MNTDQAFNLAISHHQSGRLAEAEKSYSEILNQSPRHSDAMHLLGVVSHQLGRTETGIELIRNAIAINANVPEYYCNLGLIFSDRGQLAEAVSYWRQAVAPSRIMRRRSIISAPPFTDWDRSKKPSSRIGGL